MLNNHAMIANQKALNYTNKELARALDVSIYTVIAWRRNPKSTAYRTAPANLVNLANYLLKEKTQ